MAVAVQYFADRKFYQGHGGYFRSADSRLMHREVYSSHYGNIPYSWQVHHRDGNPAHNAIENLECHPAGTHQRLAKKPIDYQWLDLICTVCGKPYRRRNTGNKQMFCSGRCKMRHYRRLRGAIHSPWLERP